MTPPPAGLEQVPVAQPNIDLQVSLRQWRPGLNTLLVDVAPYLLLCSQVDLDLWVIANGESHWKLPARQTWAPALFTVLSLARLATWFCFCTRLNKMSGLQRVVFVGICNSVCQGAFRLGLVMENELQLSAECCLSEEDNQARYLPALPNLLYLFSSITVVVPVNIGGKLDTVLILRFLWSCIARLLDT